MSRTAILATILTILQAWCLVTPAIAEARISRLTATDYTFMQQQRERVNDLAARYLGRSLSGDKRFDLEILQTLLDRDIVQQGQTLELQAMGVVIGDLMAREHKLHWVVYEDRVGRSRALQLDQSSNFVFPVTLISRRVDVGLEVDVAALYAKAIAEIREEIDNRYRRPPPIPAPS